MCFTGAASFYWGLFEFEYEKEKLLAEGLRTWSGRNYLEPNLHPTLSEQRKEGAIFFAIEKLEMDVIGKEERQFVPVFYCKDIFPYCYRSLLLKYHLKL